MEAGPVAEDWPPLTGRRDEHHARVAVIGAGRGVFGGAAAEFGLDDDGGGLPFAAQVVAEGEQGIFPARRSGRQWRRPGCRAYPSRRC